MEAVAFRSKGRQPEVQRVALNTLIRAGEWYDVVCRVDGSTFAVSCGQAELGVPFEPEFPVFIWLEVQRTGANYRRVKILKL